MIIISVEMLNLIEKNPKKLNELLIIEIIRLNYYYRVKNVNLSSSLPFTKIYSPAAWLEFLTDFNGFELRKIILITLE